MGVIFDPVISNVQDPVFATDEPELFAALTPDFDLGLDFTLNPIRAGIRTPTFTRATTATFKDYQGKNTDALSNQARIEGNRVVTNLVTSSEDMTNAAYATGGGGGVTIDSATQATFDGTFDSIYQAVTIVDDGSGAGGRTFTFSVSVRLVSGTITADSNVYLDMQGNAINNTANQNIGSSITSTAKRFSITQSTDAAGTSVEALLLSRNDAITLEITDWQLEEVTGNITHAPSEYVSTGVGTGPDIRWDLTTSGVLNSPWSVDSAYVASIDGSQGGAVFIGNSDTAVIGKDYTVSYTISNYTAGLFAMSFDGGNANINRSANGTYVETQTCTANTLIYLRANSAFAGTVTINSIKEANHGLNRDAVKAFPYHNGNTVASTGVVTESQGPAINSATSQWIEFDGASGTYVSTPDNAANSVTGDIDIRARIAPNDWTPSSNMEIISKRGASTAAYDFVFDVGTGKLIFDFWQSTVARTLTSTVATGFADGTAHHVRVTVQMDNGSGQYEGIFYTSSSAVDDPGRVTDWVQLGDTITGSTGVGSIDDEASAVEVGARGLGGADLFIGKIFRAQVYDGINGTRVVDFNANDYVSGTTFESPYDSTDPLTNGGFDTDSDWTLDNGVSDGTQSISGGQLTLTQGAVSVWMNSSQAIDVSGIASLRLSGTMVSSSTTGAKRLGIHTSATATATPALGYANTIATTSTELSVVSDVSAYDTVYVHVVDGQGAGESSVFDNIAVTPTGGTLWTLNGTAKAFSPLAKWGDFPGSSGDYISTPDSAAASQESDLGGAVWLAADDWTPSAVESVLSKWLVTGDQRSYMLRIEANGTLELTLSADGTSGSQPAANSTVATGFANGSGHWIGFAWDDSANTVTFYTSESSPLTPYNEIVWTVLGDADVTLTAAGIFDGSAQIEISGRTSGTTDPFAGTIARAAVFNTTDISNAVPVVDFDARAFTPGVSTAVGPDGATYTVNGNVSIKQNIPSKWVADGPYGYLAEEARTNLALYSTPGDLGTTWTQVNAASVVNYAVAPDGSKTAVRLLDDSATGTGSVALNQAITVSSGATTFSYHVHSDQLSMVRLTTSGYDAGGNGTTYFDIDGGTVGTVSSNHTVHPPESLPDGWLRIAVTFSTTTDLAGNVIIAAAQADNNTACDLDGTSSILVWGAQIEAGSFPTTYQPTAASSVARNADVLTYSATGNADSFPMTVSLDFVPANNVSTSYLISLNDGSTSNRAEMLHTGAYYPWYYAASGGVEQVNSQNTSRTPLIGVPETHTFAIAANDAEGYIEGVSQATDSSVTVPSGITDIDIGVDSAGANQPNGYIRNVKIFNKRLNDAQVSSL